MHEFSANGFVNGLSEEWDIRSTKVALSTNNPIRRIVDSMKMESNPEKDMIQLNIGDPTRFKSLRVHEEVEKAMSKALKNIRYYSYGPSYGLEEARTAVADYMSVPNNPVDPQDVIMTSGCSEAIDIVITALVNAGENLLIPRPGFSLYKALSDPLDIEVKSYNLLSHQNWEVDLNHLESQIDKRTRLIIVNNPSNPCGSVYTQEHLQEIVDIAYKYKIPILADEIYAHFVFPGYKFYPLATLSKEVPVLACGGLTKRYLTPGWRMGWIAIHDPFSNLNREVREGMINLTQRHCGPNTLVQGAIKDILTKVPQSYFDEVIGIIAQNSLKFYHELCKITGLRPIMPKGALYMMVEIEMGHFPDFDSDMQFVERLLAEQSVFFLPGKCFEMPGYLRTVLTLPEDKLHEVSERLSEFCEKYYR